MYVNDKDFKRDIENEKKAFEEIRKITGIKPIMLGFELKDEIRKVIERYEGNVDDQVFEVMRLIKRNMIWK